MSCTVIFVHKFLCANGMWTAVVQIAKNIGKEFFEEIFEKRLEIGQILSRLLEGILSLDDL